MNYLLIEHGKTTIYLLKNITICQKGEMKCSSIFEIKTEMKSLVTHDYQTNSIALIKNTVHKMKNLSVKKLAH